MPGAIRPSKKAMKIAYKVLKTPKVLQQRAEPKPSERLLKEWYRDSSTHQ